MQMSVNSGEPGERNWYRQADISWLWLGVAALALAGLFALLLVLSRIPGSEHFIPLLDLFHTSLVIHVNLSVLIWFLAMAGLYWSAFGQSRLRWPQWLFASGLLLLPLSALTPGEAAVMSNYVPVLPRPLFFTALVLVILGSAGQAVLALSGRGNLAGRLMALALLSALLLLISNLSRLHGGYQGHALYEFLFWGPGHQLQWLYGVLALVTWRLLIDDGSVDSALHDRRWQFSYLALLLPVFGGLLGGLFTAPDSLQQRQIFTQLMRYGGLLYLPALWLLVRSTRIARKDLYRSVLVFSLGLFLAGGLLGWSISGVNTVIPAHYHGSTVAITLLLMGGAWRLLERRGYRLPEGRWLTWQPTIYGTGQLLHITGLAVSGALGVQRKTAGAAQGLEQLHAKLAMGVMGLGGLLAIIGGLMFVLAILRCLWVGRLRHGNISR